MDHRASERTPRAFFLTSLAAVVAVLAASVWGYWQYATAVPVFRPKLPPPPQPNGYERAMAAAKRGKARGLPPIWTISVGGSPVALRAKVAPWRPVLADVRETFDMEWGGPLPLGPQQVMSDGFADLSIYLRACGRLFAAEAYEARHEGDPSRALACALDAIELGSKTPQRAGAIPWRVAYAIHSIGLDEAQRVALSVPASAIPAALERVRRARRNWPRVSEMWEHERISLLAVVTEVMRSMREESLGQQLVALRSLQAQPSTMASLRIALKPRRQSVVALDRFFRQRITEGRKPFPRRRPVAVPDDPWCQAFVEGFADEKVGQYEQYLNGLALLEIALAVRVHRVTHGRYPTRLAEIDRRWLPAVPRDQWDQPIGYRLRRGEPVLYSFGPDGKDDGGRATDATGLTPVSRGDLVFGRLTRRLEPPGK